MTPNRAAAQLAAIAEYVSALVLRQDGIFVFRIGTDGTAERIAVEVGDSHASRRRRWFRLRPLSPFAGSRGWPQCRRTPGLHRFGGAPR